MNLLAYVVPIFVGLILLEVLAAKLMRRDVYRIHDAVTSMNVGIMSEVVRSTVKLLTVVIYAVVVSKLGAFTWDLKSPWVWILAFFMYDFGYYWAHRAGHEVSLLWGAHVVHHNSEEFNLSTALRQSSTNTIFYWVFYAPMALLGIPVQVFVITAFASAVYQFWVHTQLIDRMGWLEKIFTTPSNHRVHHGKNEYCLNRNYGGTLIIWDRMFGTYAREREDEPVIFGTITPVNSWNPIWTNIVHYVSIVRNAFAFGGWKNKLQSVFAPPGWTPQGMPPHPPVDPELKFQTPCGPWQRAYCVLGCAIVYGLAMHWLIVAHSLSVPERVAYGLVNVLAALGLSGLMSHQRLGVPLEFARVVVVFGALATNVWFAPIAPVFQVLAVPGMAVSVFLLYKVHVEQHQGTQSSGRDGGSATGVPV